MTARQQWAAAVRESPLERTFAFQLMAAKLPEPVRELRFAPPRRWRFDFAWPDRMVAVEVEGGTWNGGRHVRPAGFAADCQKHNTAARLGWVVLRFTGDMIESGEALQWIEEMLR